MMIKVIICDVDVIINDDDDVFVADCFTREEATWDITPITGVVACNNTQTYTQMCTRV